MQIRIEKPPAIQHRKKTRVAAYARVSVESEMSHHSLSNQVETYKQMIANRPDWEFAGIYADEALTGTKANRPGFQKLMKDCQSHLIDMVIVKSISRFARNTVDLLNTTRSLKDLGINVRFENEHIDSISNEGELLMTMLASFAQEESRSASENKKWAIRKGFEQGRVNHFFLYGYRWDGNAFHIVPEQAEIVRWIFDSYNAGMSPHKIAKELGIRGELTATGVPFSYNRIWKVLRMEQYTGVALLQKTYRENHITKKRMTNLGELQMFRADGVFPPIISTQLFEEVQKEIARRATLGMRANTDISFSCFSGILVCGNCASTYRRKCKNKSGHIWACGRKIDHGKSCCDAQNINEKVLRRLTSDVLVIKEFSDDQFHSKIDHITVYKYGSLTFHMTDGTETMRLFSNDSKEVSDGHTGNIDSSDKKQIHVQAP